MIALVYRLWKSSTTGGWQVFIFSAVFFFGTIGSIECALWITRGQDATFPHTRVPALMIGPFVLLGIVVFKAVSTRRATKREQRDIAGRDDSPAGDVFDDGSVADGEGSAA